MNDFPEFMKNPANKIDQVRNLPKILKVLSSTAQTAARWLIGRILSVEIRRTYA